jgi:hypothetical protein
MHITFSIKSSLKRDQCRLKKELENTSKNKDMDKICDQKVDIKLI